MIAFERWDVVTALFPFTDVAVRRPRPVLVLSGAEFNRQHGQLVGCMITRALQSRWPSDHEILDLGPMGLRHASVVRWKLFTLPFTVVSRRIGTLATVDCEPVAAKLARILID
jgi:mRNA-degrading endonuclease toxin of MazEF toxin-antitoxin module